MVFSNTYGQEFQLSIKEKNNLKSTIIDKLIYQKYHTTEESIYKEIDVVSAKPSSDELNSVKHFGIDVLNPDDWRVHRTIL